MTDDNPGGGVQHVDQGGDEDALLDMGGRPEGDAALLPLGGGVAARENSQDGLAGVGRTPRSPQPTQP